MFLGNSLAVQWLGLHASTAGGMASIPGQGTMIPHAAWCGNEERKKRKKERKKERNNNFFLPSALTLC